MFGPGGCLIAEHVEVVIVPDCDYFLPEEDVQSRRGDEQILFVIAIVVGEKAFGALFTSPPRPVRVAAGYLIGTASTMWLIGALNSFWS